MNWQTGTYIGIVLLSTVVTGVLAWQARKQRSVPGSRFYFWVALAMCSMSVEELLAMLGPTQALALFWFKMRFLQFAIIPPLWFLFVLEYRGRGNWISKGLVAGLFAIPFVTQIMLWSNPAGLWLQQEVGFSKVGAVWVADISQRVPGVWYLVHVFTTQIMMLAGSVLLLQAAWKSARLYRIQAALLTTSALVPVIIATATTFNLLPKGSMNPTVPGFALAALLAAAAIFRFDFLKKPIAEQEDKTERLKAQENRSLTFFLLVFGMMAAEIAAFAFINYQGYREQFQAQVEKQLLSIAELKVKGLTAWRDERMADANLLQKSSVFSDLVKNSLGDPADAKSVAALQTWLDSLRSDHQYDRIFLLDSQGVERIASPQTPASAASDLTAQETAILNSGQVSFLDLHREAEGPIHMALLVPIYEMGDLARPLGMLVLGMLPTTYLYPYLNEWPAVSQTAETLLVRRDGQEVAYLNPLRFLPDAALTLRLPLTDTNVLAVKALLSGQTKVAEGVDYRGQNVIGAFTPVPDSPWVLVARMDLAEVNTPLQARLWETILFFGMLLLAAGAGLFVLWRQQSLRFYRTSFESAEALRESQERFRKAVVYAPFPIMIHAEDGKVELINDEWTKVTGYSHADIPTTAAWTEKAYGDRKELVREDIEKLYGIKEKVDEGEYVITTSTGEKRNWYFSSTSLGLTPDGRRMAMSMALDITELKQAQNEAYESHEILRAVNEGTANVIAVKDRQGRLLWANPAMLNFLGKTESEVIGKSDLEFVATAEQAMAISEDDRRVIESGQSQTLEESGDSPAGEWTILWTKSPFRNAEGEVIGVIGIGADISERKRIERTLLESENRYRSLFENMLNGFAYCQMVYEEGQPVDFTYLAVNAAFESLTGLKEVSGKKVSEVIPGIQRSDPGLIETYGRVALTGQPETLETYVEALQMWFSISVYSPKKGYFVSVFDVITERKQAEQQLKRSEENLRAILDATPFPIAVVDLQDDAIRYWSRSALSLFGHTAPSSASWYEMAYPDPEYRREVVERWKPALDKAQRTHQPVNTGEYRVTCQDGSERICELYATCLPDSLIVTFNDITQRKQAEADLRQSEDKFKYVFDNSIVGKSLTEPSGKLNVNMALCKMLGYTMEEFKSKKWQEITHPEDIQETQALVDSILTGGEDSGRIEKRYIHKDGSVVWADLSTTIRRDPDGKPLYFMSSVLDIRERKKAEAELRQAMEDLKRSNAELEQFAYVASHDLQEPLRMVSSYMQLMERRYKGKLGKDADEFIGFAVDGAGRMQHLINDLLLYSRVGTRGQPFTACSSQAALEEALENLQVSIQESQAEVTHEPLPEVLADEVQLVQLFQNLVGNAIKFHGEVPPKVHVEAHIPPGKKEWVFSVRDNGIGMDMQYAERVFVIFQRLNTREKFAGTGIGLAMCKKIVQRHGGRIWFESAPGKGTTFYFSIPI